MINKKHVIIYSVALAGLAVFFSTKQAPLSVLSSTSKKIPSLSTGTITKLDPQTPKRKPSSIAYVNTPSPKWKERFLSALKAQGGDSLKNISIKKERSLIWSQDSNPLMVESVVVTLTDTQDQESSFRALVDSQTGKVIETWDRSITDPADVRAGFQIKLDQRYSN